MMRLPRPEYAALGVCALIAVCMTVCALLHVDPPAVFPTLATIALSAGVGIAAPALLAATSSTSTETTAAAPLSPPAAAVEVPAPAAAPVVETAPAVASHAP